MSDRGRSHDHDHDHGPERDTTDAPSRSVAERLASVDAYRGFVMFLMMAEVLHFAAVARSHAESPVWKFLAHHQEHVEWVGCSLHDMIQPSFSFLVGVALPYSIASRRRRGQSPLGMTVHAVWRALVLVGLGIFLRSTRAEQTNFTFEDTLTQIGLGYAFLFVLGFRPARDQWIALGVILVGYFAAFAWYSPPAGLETSATGVPKDWPHLAGGFAAHWNKNANLAWAFDRWFLNLFPRARPFAYNGGGYATLSFIPTLGTMILGLIAGGILHDPEKQSSAAKKVGLLVAIGATILALGWGLGWAGVCPVVKRIWTPSWTLFSGGTCFLMLAAFYTVVDLARLRVLFLPLIVIGVNSIAAYCMSGLIKGFVEKSLTTHFGREVFNVLGPEYGQTLLGAAVLLVLWSILLWMYRRRIFLRI